MWIDGSLVRKLNERDVAYKNGKVTRENRVDKQYADESRWQNTYRDKVEEQFSGSDTKPMSQGLLNITDYKKKTNDSITIALPLPISTKGMHM
jgi:hypothetical protein